MKNYQLLKRQAARLRKRGLSYNEITRKIPVAKSTLSLWLKAIPLKAEHRKRLYTKQIAILARGPQSQRERRKREVEKIIQDAKKEVVLPISEEAYRLMGAALYWAEGSKTRNFELTNSDPRMIVFFVRWVAHVFSVDCKKLSAYLNIYPQQNESRIKKFWSELTGIPLRNFGKSFVKPLSKNYKKNNLYFGTIKVVVPRGTDMRYRVYGWIGAAFSRWEATVDLTEYKWQSLKEVKRPVNM